MDPEYLVNVAKRIGADEVIVFVEGDDDAAVYRLLDERLLPLGASTMPCSGRSNLLEVYKRKADIGHDRVIYVADKDLYSLSGTPPEYADIIWTKGYSIENDLLFGETLISLFSKAELEIYRRGIENISAWYTLNILSQISRGRMKISVHPSKIVDGSGNLNAHLTNMERIKGTPMYQYIHENYQLILRGKIITLWIAHIISSRRVGVKYNVDNLIDMAYRFNSNCLMKATFNEVIGQVEAKK